MAATTQNSSSFGHSFNVGAGKNYSVNQIIDSLIKFSGNSILPVYGPAVVEARHSLAETTKINSMLGWSAIKLLEEGLKETYNHYTKN